MLKKFKDSIIAKAAVAVSLVAASATSSAALPTEATQAFADLSTDGASLIGLGWGVAAVVTGGVILIGVFKKVVTKST